MNACHASAYLYYVYAHRTPKNRYKWVQNLLNSIKARREKKKEKKNKLHRCTKAQV